MDRVVTLVDDSNKSVGYDTWTNCHFGKGRRHRGFVVLLWDDLGNVYLQKRKHKVFDGLWDLTSISHPYKIGKHQESLEVAALRSLKMEMGIGKVDLKNIGGFVYFAKDGKWCENEYCHILVGKFDGNFKPNLKLVYGAKKVPYEEFMGDIAKNPKKYTPWARLTVKQLDESKSKWKVESESSRFFGTIFEEDLKQFLNVFEPYAKRYFAKKIKSAKKYDPLIVQFYKDLADFSAGGKRLRAFLVFLGYKLNSSRYARTINSLLPLCLAVEILHSFLLIHDDIADKSDMRRGKPTIHKRYEREILHFVQNDKKGPGERGGEHYGMSQAIILGDIACFEAFNLIANSDFEPDVKVRCQMELTKVLLETGYGEALDILNSHRKTRLLDILKVCDLKTARYSFVGPLTIGALLGQNPVGVGTKHPRGVSGSIEQYGLKVGMAYQLRDDILGVFGDEKVLGKSVLSDMREGKNTLLMMKDSKDSKEIKGIWGNKKAGTKELERVREILRKSGALEWCEGEMKKLVQEAKRHAGKIIKDAKMRQILWEIADFVVEREK